MPAGSSALISTLVGKDLINLVAVARAFDGERPHHAIAGIAPFVVIGDLVVVLFGFGIEPLEAGADGQFGVVVEIDAYRLVVGVDDIDNLHVIGDQNLIANVFVLHAGFVVTEAQPVKNVVSSGPGVTVLCARPQADGRRER